MVSVVVDASVAVAWFVPERADHGHLRLLESGTVLMAPDLLHLEVASALARKARRGEVAGDVAAMVARLRGLPMTVAGFATLLDAAVALSFRLRHGVRDCLYLAMAQRERAGLATFDERQAAHATTLGIPLWAAP